MNSWSCNEWLSADAPEKLWSGTTAKNSLDLSFLPEIEFNIIINIMEYEVLKHSEGLTSCLTWNTENKFWSNRYIKILKKFLETGWGRLWLKQIEMQISYYWSQTSLNWFFQAISYIIGFIHVIARWWTHDLAMSDSLPLGKLLHSLLASFLSFALSNKMLQRRVQQMQKSITWIRFALNWELSRNLQTLVIWAKKCVLSCYHSFWITRNWRMKLTMHEITWNKSHFKVYRALFIEPLFRYPETLFLSPFKHIFFLWLKIIAWQCNLLHLTA